MARRTRATTTRPADAAGRADLLGEALPFFDTQTIYCGDNLQQLRRIPDTSIDLIYIDPPFNSNRNYEVFWGEARETRAFEDRHASTAAYIEFMRPRVRQLARVLKPTGSFYYHCDWHASHYVKVMLDQVFGENAFQNEIIWKRTSAHSSARRYGPVHDTIFFYTKSNSYTWNPQYQPYEPEYLKRHFEQVDPNGRRWKQGDLTGDGVRKGESGKSWRGIDVTAKGRHWALPGRLIRQYGLEGLTTLDERLDALDRAGVIYWPRKEGGVPRYKQYADAARGVPLTSLWTDIPPLNSQAAERKQIGYPTQKPRALLERIITASSNPDDIVLDAFCGCGTALVAAQRLDRRWIGIDMSPTACRVMAQRLETDCGLRAGRDFTIRDLPKDEPTLRRMPPFEFENWAVVALGGIPNRAQVGDRGIDGKLFPVSALPNPAHTRPHDHLGFMDHWYPIQVKQKDKAGRPDIDLFETAMRRAGRRKGFFVAFGYTQDAEEEIRACFRREGIEIVPVRVAQILAGDVPISLT